MPSGNMALRMHLMNNYMKINCSLCLDCAQTIRFLTPAFLLGIGNPSTCRADGAHVTNPVKALGAESLTGFAGQKPHACVAAFSFLGEQCALCGPS